MLSDRDLAATASAAKKTLAPATPEIKAAIKAELLEMGFDLLDGAPSYDPVNLTVAASSGKYRSWMKSAREPVENKELLSRRGIPARAGMADGSSVSTTCQSGFMIRTGSREWTSFKVDEVSGTSDVLLNVRNIGVTPIRGGDGILLGTCVPAT